MINDPEIARQVIGALDEASSTINESIRLVRDRCTNEEFVAYRRAAGFVMGYLYTDVLAPLYKRHPDLESPELKPPFDDDPLT